MDFLDIEFEKMSTSNLNKIQIILTKLQKEINQRIYLTNDFNCEVNKIISELKDHGHILYSLNYNSDNKIKDHTWGNNYHDLGTNGLEIQFIKPGICSVMWIISPKKEV